jgi:hypothetical protein
MSVVRLYHVLHLVKLEHMDWKKGTVEFVVAFAGAASQKSRTMHEETRLDSSEASAAPTQ